MMRKTLMMLFAALAISAAGVRVSAQPSIGLGSTTRLFFQDKQDVMPLYGVQINFEDSRMVSDWFGYSAGIDFGTYRKKNLVYTLAGTLVNGLTEMYVDIPVRAKFYIPFSDDFQLFAFAGPVPSVCLGSHTVQDKVNNFGDKSSYSRFDVMAGGGIGVDAFEHLRISLGYDHGLLDRDKTDLKLKTGVAKLMFSYIF